MTSSKPILPKGLDKLATALAREPLSNVDIMKITRNGCKIMKYEDLGDYASLDEAFGRVGAIALLYETSKQFGHWTAVIKEPGDQKGIVEVFCPYGYPVDSQLKMVPKYFRKMSGQDFPILSLMINRSEYTCQWNQLDLQSHRPHVGTCGRWVALRILWRFLTLSQFQDYFVDGTNMEGDKWVALLTMEAG